MKRGVAVVRNKGRLLAGLAAVLVAATWGCGAGGGSTNSGAGGTPPPSGGGATGATDASVSGQYNLVLTSANNGATLTTNIYTNFLQRSNQIQGSATTLVCPGNDVVACKGNESDVTITLLGTQAGANVSLSLTFPAASGPDTITMQGIMNDKVLSGTYTDSLGGSGTWAGTPSPAIFSQTNAVTFGGSFNSTSDPLMIPPTILMQIGQEVQTTITGSATITNSPCVTALNFSGYQIGDAFWLQDDASKAVLVAVPTDVTAPDNFTFSYKFEANASRCAGDTGRGTLTIGSGAGSWDY